MQPFEAFLLGLSHDPRILLRLEILEEVLRLTVFVRGVSGYAAHSGSREVSLELSFAMMGGFGALLHQERLRLAFRPKIVHGGGPVLHRHSDFVNFVLGLAHLVVACQDLSAFITVRRFGFELHDDLLGDELLAFLRAIRRHSPRWILKDLRLLTAEVVLQLVDALEELRLVLGAGHVIMTSRHVC